MDLVLMSVSFAPTSARKSLAKDLTHFKNYTIFCFFVRLFIYCIQHLLRPLSTILTNKRKKQHGAGTAVLLRVSSEDILVEYKRLI